jgi:hypothetical protein
MSTCFKCNINPCQPEQVVCLTCNTLPCTNCSETIDIDCVISTTDLSCSNGTFKITKGISAREVINQLICKINNLQDQINFIKTQLDPSICDIPQVNSIDEL